MTRTSILLAACVAFLAGCVTTGAGDKKAYDAAADVSPIKVSAKYRPVALDMSKLPVDTALTMAALAQMIRGETPVINGLSVAPGIKVAEPGLPLESFDLVGLTVLKRSEKEVSKGKTWETRNTALLTYALGPFQALMLVDATSTVSTNGVVVERASVRSLSPAQPRTLAWFVPKKAFQAAITGDKAIPVWDLMDLANSLSVPVGGGKPAARDDYQAVVFVLDRLEPSDDVSGWVSGKPVDEPGWLGSTRSNEGVGFHVLMIDVRGPLNVLEQEQYVHVSWKPGNTGRTGRKALDVPIGRFSTAGTVLKAATNASANTVRSAESDTPLSSGKRLLDLKNKPDAITAQSRLIELGLMSGKADGDFGKGSRAALQRFKKERGLGENSTWDAETQKALFAGTGK